MRGALPSALTALALVAVAPRAAHAGEGERSVGLSLGVASLTLPDRAPIGAAVGLDLRRGWNDTVWLRAAVLGAAVTGDDGEAYVGQAIVGVTYAIDVLKYVPYVDAGIGAAVVDGGTDAGDLVVHPEIEIGLGLDVLHSRSLSWGPVVRVASYLDESAVLTGGVRLAYRWGFF